MQLSIRGSREAAWIAAFLTLLAVLSIPVTAHAQLTLHATRGAFDTAAPGTTLVDFEAGTIANAATGATFSGPLSSATSNAVFAAASIPAGITFSSSCLPSDNLILAGPGYDDFGWSGSGGFPSKSLIPLSDACSLSIRFDPPVTAVGLDLFAEGEPGSYRVYVEGADDALLGTYDGSASETVATFFGVTSTAPIVEILVKAPSGTATGAFEAVDNVAFLPAAAPGGAEVPALGTGAVLLMALLVAGVALLALRHVAP